MKRYVIAILLILLIVLGLGYYYLLSPFSHVQETTFVYIDSDDTADSVYAKLEPLSSRHAMTGFTTLARHCGYEKNIRTGRYAIEPGQRTFEVMRRLKNGQQQPLRLTVPSVRTTRQMAGRLARKLMVDSLTLASMLTDSATCAAFGYDTTTMVCLFIPNTYEVYWDVSAEQLMQRLRKERDVFWTEKRLAAANAIGLTPVEVHTLASIVDEETANDAEKPTVAGLYMNRLRQHIPLQADPTVKFALGDFSLRRIYRHMLNVESPYNTYRHLGLPPGPIRVASVAGIDAVLHHATHPYLYMCANPDFSGTHIFAQTYRQHLKNAQAYSKALNERGIK